jgi:hypothetical protein
MFRHGVAYVERGGPASDNFELVFKKSEMNDVLKSLALWVAAGEARVGAVAFEAPEDPQGALEERNLLFDPRLVASDLLTAMRGRRVEVHAIETLQGEVLGIEETPNTSGAPRRQLVLAIGEGQVALVDLANVQRFSLCETPSRADLAFLIDRSKAASGGTTRSVRVEIDGRATDLRVAYVIPAPVWRVSYRIALEEDEATLMAWGIVHNPVDDELVDVELTLTTGQPVSFVIDLYHKKNVERVVVEEKSRAASAPRELERGYGVLEDEGRAQKAPPRARALAAPAGFFPGPQAPPPPAMPAQAFGMAPEQVASAVERGELFEFRLPRPVSIKRGGSAMVPLATARPRPRKQRIWRDGNEPNPDLVVSFDNDSGMVLEEGPIVVYEEGGYAGEAMVPYSARGAEVKLAYAKDLAVRCKHEVKAHNEVSGLQLAHDAAVEELRFRFIHDLRAENDHDEPVKVLFEMPRIHAREIDPEGPKPIEETASTRRFEVEAPAHGVGKLEVREIQLSYRRVGYNNMSARELESWLKGRYLDEPSYKQLSSVLAAWQRAADLESEVGRLEQERQALYEKITKLSEQLGVLRDSGEEGKLRLRYVNELGEAQNNVNEREKRMAELRTEAERFRSDARRRLAQLTHKEDS